MYRSEEHKISFFDFNQSCGVRLNKDNDFTLLNDACVKLEEMIDYFHEQYHPWDKPRTYRRTMRKEYLAVAKMRRRPAKKIRVIIRKLLGCLNRDLRYFEDYMAAGYAPASKFIDYYLKYEAKLKLKHWLGSAQSMMSA